MDYNYILLKLLYKQDYKINIWCFINNYINSLYIITIYYNIYVIYGYNKYHYIIYHYIYL